IHGGLICVGICQLWSFLGRRLIFPFPIRRKRTRIRLCCRLRRWPFRRALSCYWFFISGKNARTATNGARDDCDEGEEQFHCSLSSFLPGQASCCNALILCSVSSDLPATALVASRCFNQAIWSCLTFLNCAGESRK